MIKQTLKTLVLTSIIFPLITQAQDVVKYPNQNDDLSKRWTWAEREAKSGKYRNGVWIGYSIQRLMGENSHIGSFSRDYQDKITLEELIYGKKADPDEKLSDKEIIERTIKETLDELKDEKKEERKVLKEVAILFRYESNSKRFEDVKKTKVTNLTLHVNLDELPLIWLGQIEHENSLEFLQDFAEGVTSVEMKKRFTMVIGIHDANKRSIAILKEFATKDEHAEVRKSASFWLGQTHHKEALDILKKIIQSDRSSNVREHAVFAISRMRSQESTDVLIDLAQKSKDFEVRSKAIFWLGQKASRKAEKALEDLVYSDDETKVRKKAVFALTQLPHNKGVPHLIRIAKTHPNIKVRKQAIFWLGQSKDPRAFETIVELIRKK
ncbi:HEAT repeat domain-containing protein [candidate division KSB1 bacterium]|nr:HEAT repeat domain-containing protein [candidate division KSB1 bacterium]